MRKYQVTSNEDTAMSVAFTLQKCQVHERTPLPPEKDADDTSRLKETKETRSGKNKEHL